jgi:hypothetical protein
MAEAGTEALVELMGEVGINHVSGIAGDSVNPIGNAMRRHTEIESTIASQPSPIPRLAMSSAPSTDAVSPPCGGLSEVRTDRATLRWAV